MIPGAISNSWRIQLADQDCQTWWSRRGPGRTTRGAAPDLPGRLRDGRGRRLAPGVSEDAVAGRPFPQLTFDLAMALPCLTQSIDPKGGLFQGPWRGEAGGRGQSPSTHRGPRGGGRRMAGAGLPRRRGGWWS